MANREPTRYEGVFEYATKKGERRFLARWRDLNGRACEKGGFLTAKAAKDHRMTVSAEKAAGVERDPAAERMKFEEWAKRWWKAKRPTIAPNTQAQYGSMLELHVLPVLGPRRLRAIRKIDVEELVAALSADNGGPLGPSGVRTCRTLVGQILQSALENNCISSNPARGVKVPKAPKTRHLALTKEQVHDLAAAVPAEYRALVLLLAYAGLRPGEALALRREDVDEVGRRVFIHASVSEVGGRLERRETTKTDEERRIKVVSIAMAALLEHMSERVLWAPEAPLFTTARGGPVRLSTFRNRVFAPAVKAAGLPAETVPYTLRHTCASWLARQGVHPKKAAAMLGHDPAEFMSTYAHLFDDDLDAAADALELLEDPPAAPRLGVIELPTHRAEGTRP